MAYYPNLGKKIKGILKSKMEARHETVSMSQLRQGVTKEEFYNDIAKLRNDIADAVGNAVDEELKNLRKLIVKVEEQCNKRYEPKH